MSINKKLKSRKLWLTVATALYAVLGAITGHMEWLAACKIILTTVGIYTGSEAFVDALHLKK